MSKLDELLNQITAAAKDLKQQVLAIDRQILTCQKQRDELTSAPVSKADFLDYLKSDMRRKYQNSYFLDTLKRRLSSMSREFGALENTDKNGFSQQVAYLTGDAASAVIIKDEAIFFYFEDVILGRIASLLDGEAWPESAVPVEERKALIADLDKRIISLKQDRKKLTDQLIAAGLQG